MKGNRLRTVVCGSTFGQFYLEALKALPEQFELVGLFAKGSERSKKCAAHYGVDLYTEVDKLPDNTELACVVLRSGVIGGKGTELSLQLLERGIHVIQEQPVHHKDLASCLRAARQNGLHFGSGDLYLHLPAVRRFAACAHAMLEQQNALYIDAACATQVSFPMMHILLEALPTIRPLKISNVVKDEGPFQVLTGVLGKVPFILRAHNEVDPKDPDNHLHLLHRLTIGVEGGSLSLTDTHGPVVWHPRLHIPNNNNLLAEPLTTDTTHFLENSTQTLGPAAPTRYKEILMKQWTRAIGRDLSAMRETIHGNANIDTRAQQELLCSRQWQDLTNALGYPVLRNNRSHQPLAVAILKEAASKIIEDPEERFDQVSHPKTEVDVFKSTDYAEDEIQGIDRQQVSLFIERLDEAVLSSMLFALQSQGTLIKAEHEYGKAEILSTSKVASHHQNLILRWLQILTEREYLKQRGKYFLGTDLVTSDTMRQRWELVKEVWDGKLGSPISIDYLITNAEQLPQLMSDRQQAALLLFPEGRMDVAKTLYQDTIAARYLNKSIAEAVVRIAVRKQISTSSNTSLRILEIGAGTGATTDVVAKKLKTYGSESLKIDYLFTDVSNFFLAEARERFKDCPWMRFQIINIDQNLFEQGVNSESVDIVIAAGVLNNAHNTDKVIQDLMQSLVPQSGWMLITEPVREFLEILISQAFMMTHPEDDRKRTETTFMSVKRWLDVFNQVGAHKTAILPDEKHIIAPLGQKLFIVRKKKDA